MKEKYTWNDVTLAQFNGLQDVMKIEDDVEKAIALAELMFGENITDLPLAEFNSVVRKLKFLQEEMPNTVPPKKLEINGRKYYTDCLLGNISTAQYVDFTNHSKTNDTAKILSCFIIPEGHKYNDGYDMQQVIGDIEEMPVPTAFSISFFFARQFSKFMGIFQTYSIRRIKKLKLPKPAKEAMIKAVQYSTSLALSPIS